MSRKERDKGVRGEQELAALFRDAGHQVEQLQRNQNGVSDLVIDRWLYVDSKRQERMQLAMWIRQATENAPDGTVPAVAFRASREPWGIWLPALDFAERMP